MEPPFQTQPKDSGKGAIVLVLGIVGLVSCGCVTGIPAWVMGNEVLERHEAGWIPDSEAGLARVGRILGIIATCLSSCGVICWVLMMMIGGMASAVREPSFDMGEIQPMIDSSAKRDAILDAAVKERQAHPKKTYAALANELTRAKGTRVKWFDEDLKPVDGCGIYTFTAVSGALTVTDGCGSDSISGWPIK